MTMYRISVAYVDDDGDETVDIAMVEAQTMSEAQEIVVENLEDYFDDAAEDQDEEDVYIVRITEA